MIADDPFLDAAVHEAQVGLAEGGIPIGSVLVIEGRIVGSGHNRRVQRASAVLHAEMDCLENAGRLVARSRILHRSSHSQWSDTGCDGRTGGAAA